MSQSVLSTYDQLLSELRRADSLAFLLEERLQALDNRPDAPNELHALSVLAETLTITLQKVLDNARALHAEGEPAPRMPLPVDAARDALYRAKGMLTLVVTTLNEDGVLIVGNDGNEDRTEAVLSACDVIGEALGSITATLEQADAPQR